MWSSAIRDWLRTRLTDIFAAAHAGNAGDLAAAFAAMEGESEQLSVALEFLIASRFDDELDEVVGLDARRIVADLRHYSCAAAEAPSAPHLQAANALLMSFSFGRMMARRSNPDLAPLLPAQCSAMVAMTNATPGGAGMPGGHEVAYLRAVPDLDAEMSRITEAVIQVIGAVGYRRATIARMGRAAGMSGGSLFGRFQDKAHIVSYSAHTRLYTPLEMWHNFEDVEASYGPNLSRAMWVASALNPVNSTYWTVQCELARVAQFVEELAAFRPSTEPHLYANLGVMMVGAFSDDIHELPYEAPFRAGFAT